MAKHVWIVPPNIKVLLGIYDIRYRIYENDIQISEGTRRTTLYRIQFKMTDGRSAEFAFMPTLDRLFPSIELFIEGVSFGIGAIAEQLFCPACGVAGTGKGICNVCGIDQSDSNSVLAFKKRRRKKQIIWLVAILLAVWGLVFFFRK